ncbi:acetyl-CoA synthetase alpha and beta chain [Dehalogenimonas sp. WBC-2]|nr:acetyl-CoA synthetase alpha and beta chain [Dehalogenimonas sp. WBC-2]
MIQDINGAIEALLRPNSIAVIGVSRREDSIGHKIFQNLLSQSFKGRVFPVNPKADVISGIKVYPSVSHIPESVDLAVMVIPADYILDAAEECGVKGVKAIIVISAGFAEAGNKGAELQRKLVAVCRRYGIRLIGPNCMGVLNTDPIVSMNATFSHVFPPHGNIAMATQSGALGLVILEYAKNLGIGLSTFVSVGNRADVSSNDLLEYWCQDPATGVIMLYLESFGNPKKFARLARAISANKPIVAVKSGRSAAGSRAAASHTGALATVDIAADALFAQTGIIRVDTLEQLFDVSNVLAHQPLPRGSRVAILTNGGGPGAMAADACTAHGLELPALSDATLEGLKMLLPSRASRTNPVDITDAGAEEYRGALMLLADDDNVDAVIVIFIPPVFARSEDVAAVIMDLSTEFYRRGKTLLSSFMGQRGCLSGSPIPAGGSSVPSFAFPESAVYALARARDYNLYRQKPCGMIPELKDIDRERVQKILDNALPGWLLAKDVYAILDAYGIRSLAPTLVTSVDEALNAAQALGYPVVLKLDSATIIHKTDFGGVVLDIRSPQELRQAYDMMMQRLTSAGRLAEVDGMNIQKMVSQGIEVIAGVAHDDVFGPLMLFGLGGIYTELFKDAVTRIHPLTDVDATEMVHSVKAYKLLEGFRGSPPADIPVIEELLLRLSALVTDFPQIKELDLNPVKVFAAGNGCTVVDARILV